MKAAHSRCVFRVADQINVLNERTRTSLLSVHFLAPIINKKEMYTRLFGPTNARIGRYRTEIERKKMKKIFEDRY